jgi:hypothetical protein
VPWSPEDLASDHPSIHRDGGASHVRSICRSDKGDHVSDLLRCCQTFDGYRRDKRGLILICVSASTRGVGLLPAYAQNFLPRSVTSRPLKGDTPTIDLVLGYKKLNQSPILKLLLSRLDELVARASNKTR